MNAPSRYKIVFGYFGPGFFGSDKHGKFPTVQSCLDLVLSQIFKETIQSIFAGRTDSGVHAYGQVAHFDATNKYPLFKIPGFANHLFQTNRWDVYVHSIECVDSEFNARFSAITKEYVYKVALVKNNVFPKMYTSTHLIVSLPYVNATQFVQQLNEQAQEFVGFHNFKSMCKEFRDHIKTHRTLDGAKVSLVRETALAAEIEITFCAKSFLYGQVRCMVGTLLFVSKEVGDISAVLNKADISYSGPKVTGVGLYLSSISY